MARGGHEHVVLPRPHAFDDRDPPQPSGHVPHFEEIYREHFGFVFRSLRALGVPSSSLDDAVQEVFVVVHRRLGDFEGRSTLRTWLFSIAYQIARNVRRRERRKGGLSPLDTETPDTHRSPEEQTAAARSWQFVAGFLARLDEGKRAVFVLCLLEEATAVEAADALGIPVNTVYSRLHALRRSFREALQARGEAERP